MNILYNDKYLPLFQEEPDIIILAHATTPESTL